jgi:hypothetical protein
MAGKVKKPVKANPKLTAYEQEMLRLMSENNALLKENNQILKSGRELMNKIEDYTRGIRSNTSSLR